jgi:DNA-binding IclR family transcriptional regulator
MVPAEERAHFGAIAANRFGLRDVAHFSLARLTERTADTIYMSIRRDYESICIERFEGDYPIKTRTLDVGGRWAWAPVAWCCSPSRTMNL